MIHMILFLFACVCSQASESCTSAEDSTALLQVHDTKDGKMDPACFVPSCREVKGWCVAQSRCCDRAKWCQVEPEPKPKPHWPPTFTWNTEAGNQSEAEELFGVKISSDVGLWINNGWSSFVGQITNVTSFEKVSSSKLMDKYEQIFQASMQFGDILNLNGYLVMWEQLPEPVSFQLCDLVRYTTGGYVSKNVRIESVVLPTVNINRTIFIKTTIVDLGSGKFEVTLEDPFNGKSIVTIENLGFCSGAGCPPAWNVNAGDQSDIESALGVTVSNDISLWSSNGWEPLLGKKSQVTAAAVTKPSPLSEGVVNFAIRSIQGEGLFDLNGMFTTFRDWGLSQPLCKPAVIEVGGYVSASERVEVMTIPGVSDPIPVTASISSTSPRTFNVILRYPDGGESTATVVDITP